MLSPNPDGPPYPLLGDHGAFDVDHL
jgi:hypothetical protein